MWMEHGDSVIDERPPVLESWYRKFLGSASHDISSSGVHPYSFSEVREKLGLEAAGLDSILMDDSTSLGAPILRRAIADRYACGMMDNVMATHGSSEAISLVLSTLLGGGGRVVTIDPIYHSLLKYAELAKCEIVRVRIEDIEERGLAATLLAEISDRTTVVIVNFPNNPTGFTLSEEELAMLSLRCRESGAMLVWDGAMEELVLSGNGTPLDPGVGGHVVRFGTLSKAFGLPGLRVGWCIASPEILARTFAMRDRTTLFLSPLVETLAAAVIGRSESFIRPRLDQARENLAYLDEWIDRHSEFLGWRRPLGGVCGLLEFKRTIDPEDFCRILLQETGVLLVPGTAFEARNSVRIGFGCPRDVLKDALGILSAALPGAL